MARKLSQLSLAVFAAMSCATPAPAQSTAWVIDSAHSTARLFVTSSNRKDIINVGVARMSGELLLSASNALPASITFEIYPADQYPRITQPAGEGSAAQSSIPWWDATLIRFQSKSLELVGEHTVRVRGEMIASYVSRPVTWAGPSFRDYSGPKYGPPLKHTATKEVIFEFQEMRRHDGEVTAKWLGSTAVGNTEFPTLWNAVASTTWPVFEGGGKVVVTLPRTDVHCEVPPTTTGESFAGEVCSGAALQILADPDNDRVPQAGRNATSGDSFADQVEIKLDVHLVKMS